MTSRSELPKQSVAPGPAPDQAFGQPRAVLGPSPGQLPKDSEPSTPVAHRTLLAQLIAERNLTYERAAAQLGISARHLARLASPGLGQPTGPPRPNTREALTALFGHPVGRLLAPPPSPARAPVVALIEHERDHTLRHTVDMPAVTLPIDRAEQGKPDVQRRRLLHSLAALGLATPTIAARPFGALEAIRAELAHDLAAAPGRIEDWTEVAWQYGHAYLTTQPEILIVDLAADLVDLHDARARETNLARQQDLLRAAAQLSALTRISTQEVRGKVQAYS